MAILGLVSGGGPALSSALPDFLGLRRLRASPLPANIGSPLTDCCPPTPALDGGLAGVYLAKFGLLGQDGIFPSYPCWSASNFQLFGTLKKVQSGKKLF